MGSLVSHDFKKKIKVTSEADANILGLDRL